MAAAQRELGSRFAPFVRGPAGRRLWRKPAGSVRRALGFCGMGLSWGLFIACGANPSEGPSQFLGQPVGNPSSDGGAPDASGERFEVVNLPPARETCTPTSPKETACDGKDEDCNGLVDDVDLGEDGICDCLNIGILGRSGSYGSSDFQDWLAKKGTRVTRLQTAPGEPLTTSALAPFDLVLLDWLQRSYSEEEAKAFGAWLQEGHGAFALSGYSDDYNPAYPNSLLGRLGVGFSSSTTVPGRANVTDFVAHPVTEGLKSVSFIGGSEVKTLPGKPPLEGTTTTLARVSGKVVATAHETKNGRAVLWGDEWIEFDSEWRTVPDVQRFWLNVFAYLAPRCRVPPPPSLR